MLLTCSSAHRFCTNTGVALGASEAKRPHASPFDHTKHATVMATLFASYTTCPSVISGPLLVRTTYIRPRSSERCLISRGVVQMQRQIACEIR
jgi:hypothetical protein